MKVYVLTNCAAEKNYTPRVFTTKAAAIEALKDSYENCIAEGDYVDHDELFDTCAEVVYIDDTYDVLEIFEVEVEDNDKKDSE